MAALCPFRFNYLKYNTDQHENKKYPGGFKMPTDGIFLSVLFPEYDITILKKILNVLLVRLSILFLF